MHKKKDDLSTKMAVLYQYNQEKIKTNKTEDGTRRVARFFFRGSDARRLWKTAFEAVHR